MKPNYQLLEDRVCLRYKKPDTEEETKSGIILKKTAKEMYYTEAEVWKVGDGSKGYSDNVEMYLKPGDKVFFKGVYGDPQEYDGYDGWLYRTMRQHEVVGYVLDEEKE